MSQENSDVVVDDSGAGVDDIVDSGVNADNDAGVTGDAADVDAETGGSKEPVDIFEVLGDDWRDRFVEKAGLEGDDAKKLRKYLDKYNDPVTAIKSGHELTRLLDSGELVKKMSDEPPEDPKELDRWRKQRGVPLDPSEYKLPDDIIVDESYSELIEDFMKTMHEHNVPDGVPQAAIKKYIEFEEQMQAKEAEELKERRLDIEVNMKEALGGEYKAVMNMANKVLSDRLSPIIAETLLYQISPEMTKAVVDIVREINPLDTIHSGNGSVSVNSVQDRLSEIRQAMLDGTYNDNMRAEYERLSNMLEKIS